MRRLCLTTLGMLALAFSIAGCSDYEDSIPPDGGSTYPCAPYNYGLELPSESTILEWTPDGAQVVFNYGPKEYPHSYYFGRNAIWTVDADGSQLRMLVEGNPHVGLGFLYGFHADVSPVNGQIVYTSCEFSTEGVGGNLGSEPERAKFHYEIAVINQDGTEQQRLTVNTFLDHYPVWSPDASRIAFIAEPREPIGRRLLSSESKLVLYMMAADGSGMQQLALPPQNSLTLAPPVWSPDGEHLAFLAYEIESTPPHYSLYTMQVDGLDTVRIAAAKANLPTWSPDGEYLAFVMADEEGKAGGVYVTRPDGTEPQQILGLHGDISQVLWSPDGEWLALLTADSEDRSGGVYTIRPDGTGLKQLLEWQDSDRKNSYASWSPDGSELLILSEGQLFLIQPDSSEPHRLEVSNHLPVWSSAVWSPDSARIAIFVSGSYEDNIPPQLYTIAPDGTDRRDLIRLDDHGNLTPANPLQEGS